MRAFRFATLTDLHEGLCERIVEAPRDELDIISSVDTQIHNVIAEARSMDWEFDLKSMWLTKSRWTMMARQYLDPEELRAWVEQCTGKISSRGRGIAVLRTRVVKPRGGDATGHRNKQTRRWGSCMLAISYKARPRPQITLYSRTSYLGYLAALDLSVAWMCGRYLARTMGIGIEDISFVWMNEALQWHYFKSMAYLLNHRDGETAEYYRHLILARDEALDEEDLSDLKVSPSLTGTRKWAKDLIRMDDQGLTYGDMSYNTYRRIRRRYHTEVLGYEEAQKWEGVQVFKNGKEKLHKAYLPLPHVPIETCDFSGLGMPIDREWGVIYDGAIEEDDEDDDDFD